MGKIKAKQKKTLTPIWIVIYILIAALFLFGVWLIVRQEVLPPDPTFVLPTPTPVPSEPAITPPQATPALSATQTAGITPTPQPINVPVKIYFSAKKQSCPIEPVGIGEGRGMGTVDSASIAGWYYYGASPGSPGTAIINGHQRFGGKAGTFSVLKKMNPGEEIIIEFEDGSFKYFETKTRETFLEEEVPAEYLTVGHNTPTRLILITCLGDYGEGGRSQSRVVVVCEEVQK